MNPYSSRWLRHPYETAGGAVLLGGIGGYLWGKLMGKKEENY